MVKGKDILYHKAFGEADKEKPIPNSTATIFNIASLGKVCTATLIMKLVEAGKIYLNAPLGKYLPEYNIPNGDSITIHHLLTHTSGLSNYMLHPHYAVKKEKYASLDSVMKLVTEMPLSFQKPGETWRYSNSGFIVLGKLIEKISGKSYMENVSRELVKALGLNQILSPRKYTAPATAVPYYAVSSKRYINESKEEAGFPYADGGIQVTANDVYKLALAILENKLLREQTRSTMLTAYGKAGRGSYGYGWMINEDYGKKFFGHTGGTLAFSSGLRMNLEDGYIVVMVSNIPTNSTWMLNSIMSILYTGRNGWPAKKPLSNIIFEIMDEKG